MKDENIKQLLYDIQREKDSQEQVELIKSFVVKSQNLNDEVELIIKDFGFIGHNDEDSHDSARLPHKFAIGTEIRFPTFEKLRLEGWVDKGPSLASIVHPLYKNVWLSYEQISDFEDTVVTITHQNKPGEYSIEEDFGVYDDWPFDLMNVLVKLSPTEPMPEKLMFDDQSLQEQVFHILHYLESEPNQTIIPDGRVRLLKETLGDYKPYDEVCYLPVIKNMADKISVQDLTQII